MPTYNKEEADLRNILMKGCFLVCENERVDVYEVMGEAKLAEMTTNKLVKYAAN